MRGTRLAFPVPTQITNAVNTEWFRFRGIAKVVSYDVNFMTSLRQSLGYPTNADGRAPSVRERASGYDRNTQSAASFHGCRFRAVRRAFRGRQGTG